MSRFLFAPSPFTGHVPSLLPRPTGSRRRSGASSTDARSLPWNVRVERFIPYAQLMPKVDVLLTNGGFGSIRIALAHGVPIVSIGKRIPTETQIRNAVSDVLEIPTYAARAEALRYEMAGLAESA